MCKISDFLTFFHWISLILTKDNKKKKIEIEK